MTETECARLRAVFETLKDRVFTSDQIDPFWNSRFLWLADVLSADPDAARLMIEKQRHGPCGSVELRFDGATTKFSDSDASDLQEAA